ncbi:MAG: 1-phosphofructokinase family hexose kinase [Phycisphaerae bacterium]|nr:1-phosphofructokinase family hexose kinase [Phycisphaerae bacterium]
MLSPTVGLRLATVTLNPTIDRVIRVPGFAVGQHLVGRLHSRTPAGKAINVSRAMAALGMPSVALGWVGRESIEAFNAAARAAGFTPQFSAMAGTTRENITVIDPQGPNETHIREIGPTVTAEEIDRLTDDLRWTADDDVIVVFTGSLAPGLPPERFGDMIEACVTRGAHVVVDTSQAPLRKALEHKVWMIKPNLVELAELVGREIATDDQIVRTGLELSKRIPWVLITAGERGVFCFAEGAAQHASVTIPPERLRSTVGCGDALLAAFLSGLVAANGTCESALRQGVAVAAASAMNDLPAVFAAEDVETLRASVQLRPLA